LAAREAEIEHEFRVADLSRLKEQSADAPATLQARFHRLDGRCAVAGRVNATLRLICQRCLQPTDLVVEDEFHVVLVGSEAEMSELPDAQDSAIADATRLDLAWLIEEQLLLAMPLVPLHANVDDCDAPVQSAPHTHMAPTANRQRPFADLRELLKK